jgi:hypothetical protein
VLHLERIETPAGLFVAAKDDSLEEHVRSRVTAVSQPPDEDPEVTQAMGARRLKEADAPPLEECTQVDTGPLALGICTLARGHKGPHKSKSGTWP